MTPSPRATPEKRIRRVFLDLIGLPPTAQEVNAFLADPSDERFEDLVDDLLQRPQFGERWARPWLDLARYADSHGFQRDNLRDIWAYRDWVIAAFNSGMPFDDFVIDQIAGDLRPDATTDHKIATGFHRMTTCNVEAGVHPEANRVNQVVDRGEPWQPSRLFYAVFTRGMFKNMRTQLESFGMDTSEMDGWESVASLWDDNDVHVALDISKSVDAKWKALNEHRTQFGSDNLFRRIPEDAAKKLMSRENFHLAIPETKSEVKYTDLFEGL